MRSEREPVEETLLRLTPEELRASQLTGYNRDRQEKLGWKH